MDSKDKKFLVKLGAQITALTKRVDNIEKVESPYEPPYKKDASIAIFDSFSTDDRNNINIGFASTRKLNKVTQSAEFIKKFQDLCTKMEVSHVELTYFRE